MSIWTAILSDPLLYIVAPAFTAARLALYAWALMKPPRAEKE